MEIGSAHSADYPSRLIANGSNKESFQCSLFIVVKFVAPVKRQVNQNGLSVHTETDTLGCESSVVRDVGGVM